MKNTFRKILFLLLCTALCLSLVPGAWAVTSRTDLFDDGYTLNGNGAHDLLAVASKQVGNSDLNDTNYGPGGWCAQFVSDCAKLAGLENIIPGSASPAGLRDNIINCGGTCWNYNIDSYINNVEKGDILIFINTYKGNERRHAAIVEDKSDTEIYCIDGNWGGAVKRVTRSRDNSINYGDGDAYSDTGWRQAITSVVRPRYNPLKSVQEFNYAKLYVCSQNADIYSQPDGEKTNTVSAGEVFRVKARGVDYNNVVWLNTVGGNWIKASQMVLYYIEDGHCTTVEGDGNLVVFENADIYSLPCNSYTDPYSQVIGSIGMPEMCVNVHANEVLTNSAGNYWYEIDYGGRPGYIWSPHALLAYRNKATCTVYSMISLSLRAEPNAESTVTKTVVLPRWATRTFNLYGYTWDSDRHKWYYTDGGYLDSDFVDTITITTSIDNSYYSGISIEQGENDPVSLTDYNIPDNLSLGTSFSVTGTLTSADSVISSVTVGVYSADGTMIIGASAQPMAKSYDLSSLAGQVSFDQLGVGSYYYRIDASNSEGTFNMIDKRFSVYSDSLEQTYYSVYYHANGGTNAPETQTGTGGQAITLSNTEPVKDRWVFSGWSCDGRTYTPGETIVLTSNLSLDAIWEAQIDTGDCGENITWRLDRTTGILTIEGYGEMYDTWRYNFGGPWSNQYVEYVRISEGVTSIGPSAFNGCSELKSIIIPGSITKIGTHAGGSYTTIFADCSKLVSAGPMWSGCSIEFGWTEGIPDHAFNGCESLELISIPNNFTYIGSSAFSRCSSLDNVVLPESVTDIGMGAFDNCTSLSHLYIPKAAVNFSGSIYYNNPKLLSAGPDGSGSSIEYGWETEFPIFAFSGCTYLSHIIVPESICEIGRDAFQGCTSITSAGPVGSGADYEYAWKTFIPEHAFMGCSGLEKVVIPGTIEHVGVYFYEFGGYSVSDGAFGDCTLLKTAGPIGSDCNIEFGWETEIPEYAFFNNEILNSLQLPETIKVIGDSAFLGTGLSSLTIPEGATSICPRAFCDCESLVSVTLPQSLTEISSSAFESCDSLESVIIPSGVTYLANNVFSDCSSLMNIQVDAANNNYCDISGVVYNKDMDTLIAFPPGRSNVFVVPSGIRRIANFAFSDCKALKEIVFPQGIAVIEQGAFWGAENLTSLTVPASLTEIQSNAFYMSGLQDIYFGGTEENWKIISIDSNNDEVLASVTIHYNALTIPEPDFILPAALTTIEEEAFAGGSFESVLIPWETNTIADDAFGERDDLVIFGYPGSSAQDYAERMGYEFYPIAFISAS